jgi:hypothetical protein
MRLQAAQVSERLNIRILVQLVEELADEPGAVAIRPDGRHAGQNLGKADEDG